MFENLSQFWLYLPVLYLRVSKLLLQLLASFAYTLPAKLRQLQIVDYCVLKVPTSHWQRSPQPVGNPILALTHDSHWNYFVSSTVPVSEMIYNRTRSRKHRKSSSDFQNLSPSFLYFRNKGVLKPLSPNHTLHWLPVDLQVIKTRVLRWRMVTENHHSFNLGLLGSCLLRNLAYCSVMI